MTSGRIRIEIKTDPPVAELMAKWPGRLQAASWKALRDQTAETKAEMRQTISAGLGGRAGNLVGAKVYGGALPLGKIFSRWWKRSPNGGRRDVLGAFASGGLIASEKGFWLAIPLPASGMRIGRKRITPGAWERSHRQRLRFVYMRGRGRALLVADNQELFYGSFRENIQHLHAGRGSRFSPIEGRTTVPIFLLVPTVRLPKRFDIEEPKRRATQGLADRFFEALAKRSGATVAPPGEFDVEWV